MKEYKYLKEEFHRGEWQPLIVKNSKGEKIQAFSKITEEEARIMNVNKDAYKVRYVKEEIKKEVKESSLREQYEELAGKKPFNGWSDKQLIEKIEELKK